MTTQITRGKVITVERGQRKFRAGQGLLKGMGVIWHHWVQSFRKLEKFSETAGTFTIEYPEERRQLPETYRNMPILLYDDATGQELCTSCFQCQRICPPQVIHMTQAKDPATGKAVPAVAEFVIEYDACMSCGFCAEVCPFDAIKMDHEFELSTADHPRLTVHKQDLNRPISYYEKIAPSLWAEVKDGAYKKLQGNIKRRPGVLGIAPQMIERVKAQQAAAPVAAPAPPTPPPTRPVAPTPEAAATPASAEDKAARLAAIRAANAAKQGDAAPAAAPAASPAEDKAARLAAIRAANAAKQGSDVTPAATPAASPAEDKAARLAAIRAANAAKQSGAAAPTPETKAAVPTGQDASAAAGTNGDEGASDVPSGSQAQRDQA